MCDFEIDTKGDADLFSQLLSEVAQMPEDVDAEFDPDAPVLEIKEEPVVEVKQEPASLRDDKKRKRKADGKQRPTDDAEKKKALAEQELRYQAAHESVFGNKEKLLRNLAAAAKGDEKEAKTSLRKKKARKPVWKDSDDEGEELITNPETKATELKQKQTYKKQLQNKFERILGTPAWAALDRKQEVDSDDELLQTVGHLANPESKSLVRGLLSFKKMKDLNRATYAEGPSITGVEFHPHSTVSLVAGSQGIATIYSIDGRKNEKLHSLELKNYPIRSCRLNKDGTEAIFGGSQKFFYTFDLMGGQTQRVFLPKTITKLGKFEVSPCGKHIAVIGRFGEVHVLDAITKELICTLKQEYAATSLTFSADSNQLLTHCVDAEVNIFDLREQKLMHRFIDEGCINGSCVAVSPNGHMLATGSEQGVVNVYNYSSVFKNNCPVPEKSILNLTTAISTATFNHTSELLAFASKDVNDAIKLAHFPSGTVYSNFPGIQGNVGKASVVRFSPQSGYLAIGNLAKEVALYRLKHYNDYWTLIWFCLIISYSEENKQLHLIDIGV